MSAFSCAGEKKKGAVNDQSWAFLRNQGRHKGSAKLTPLQRVSQVQPKNAAIFGPICPSGGKKKQYSGIRAW